jgi:hypothetical protein
MSSGASVAAWQAAHTAAREWVAGGADPSVARAVLSQWIAENGWHWPPARNNPGNIAKGAAVDLPGTWHAVFPNPQPGNPIVTYATLEMGLEAYAAALRTFQRYANALPLVRAGRGLDAMVQVCADGWGTNSATVRSVYAALGTDPTGPAPAPVPVEEPMDPTVIPDQVVDVAPGGTLYKRVNGALVVLGAAWPGGTAVGTYGVQPAAQPPRPATAAPLRALRIDTSSAPGLQFAVGYVGEDKCSNLRARA